MDPIIDCLFQPYDHRLVVLAVIVCAVASLATFNLYPRAISEAEKAKAHLWITLTSITAGSAVWTTLFMAMLAFDPALRIGYEVSTTIASFIVVMVAMEATFITAVHLRRRRGIVVPGIMLGLATAAMHYTGVGGMELAGRLIWDAKIVVVSVLLSVGLSVAALAACGSGATRRQRMTGALLFALSIAALHVTGMAAITIVAEPDKILSSHLLSGDLLAVSVGIVTLLIVASGAVAWRIDRRKHHEAHLRLRYMARHDLLTSLPNRLLFEEISKRELTEIAAAQRTAAVLCLDLDGFKEVNDIFGHAAGDALLVEVARRLQALLGERCLAARLGGDEFAVLATALSPIRTPAFAAQSVLDVLGEPYEIDGSLLDIGCSIGVAIFPADGTTHAQLLARADVALSRAKTDGRGVFRFFERSMDETMRKRRQLGLDLRAALGSDQLRLVYQPQHDLENGTVTGFEALARWDHPKLGPIAPATFIPLAEETGIILPLGEWVLREACEEAARWAAPLTVAVNIAVAQFRQNNFLDMITSVLRETGLPAERLDIEVTEGLFQETVPRTLQTLERLKAMGVRIAIDDFGTGLSSLSTLQSFAFDKIKIDRSFMEQIGHAAQIGDAGQIGHVAKSPALVKAVIFLGEALGTAVIAEGVETNEQVDFLRRQNCRHVQGNLYGKPLPIECYAALSSGRGHEPAKRVA